MTSTNSLKIRTSALLDAYRQPPVKRNDSISNSKKIQGIENKIINKDSNSFADLKLQPKVDSSLLKKPSILQNDSSKFPLSKKVKRIFPAGTVSLGYDYGFLPYTVNMPSPTSAVKTEGLIESDIFNIPLDISYFYSTQKNLIGLNNYFRISFNADRYRDKLNTKLNGNIDSYKSSLGPMNLQKQQLTQKMAYADYLSSVNPDKWPVDTLALNDKLTVPNAGANETDLPEISKPDTAGLNKYKQVGAKSKPDHYASKEDSIRQQAVLYKHKKDSVAGLYGTYKKQYALLNDSIKRTENRITELETLINQKPSYSEKNSPYLTKVQNFLSGVRKLDVGLCYPAYSTFLANNIPVRGINFEYQKNRFFFAFTYGTTVSTLLYNTNNVEGLLQNIRNSYNYFDANNLSAGRKILSVKFGAGEKEKDHFFVGFLVGKGANSYFPGGPVDIALRPVESNLVLEADARKKLGKHTMLDLVVGKSSIQEEDLNMHAIKTAAKEIFSDFRSYGALVKLKTSIAVTRSNITFSIRWIDPFFNSFGIGFMRSDNVRYEVKLDQPLTKALRYTVIFRYEEDNLLKLLNYKNTFYSMNNMLSYKIKRGLVLRAGYTPLTRTLNSENYRAKNKNAIVTGILTFTPRTKGGQKQFSLLYNNYHVNTDTTPINFQNFSYSHQISFKSGFKTGLDVSWFKNNLNDSIGNDVYLAVLEVGYQFKNGSVLSVAGKSAYKRNGRLYPGFIVKSTIRLSKTLFWENQVEKFIVGDLFNGYNLENLQRFPYCFTTKLILNF